MTLRIKWSSFLEQKRMENLKPCCPDVVVPKTLSLENGPQSLTEDGAHHVEVLLVDAHALVLSSHLTLGSISSAFYVQLLRQYSCVKKLQNQTVTREKLWKTLSYEKRLSPNVDEIDA
jgi:hypothetical protein